jgi:hypothetical protein
MPAVCMLEQSRWPQCAVRHLFPRLRPISSVSHVCDYIMVRSLRFVKWYGATLREFTSHLMVQIEYMPGEFVGKGSSSCGSIGRTTVMHAFLLGRSRPNGFRIWKTKSMFRSVRDGTFRNSPYDQRPSARYRGVDAAGIHTSSARPKLHWDTTLKVESEAYQIDCPNISFVP